MVIFHSYVSLPEGMRSFFFAQVFGYATLSLAISVGQTNLESNIAVEKPPFLLEVTDTPW